MLNCLYNTSYTTCYLYLFGLRVSRSLVASLIAPVDYNWMVERAAVIVVQHGKESAMPFLKDLFRDMFADEEIDIYKLLLTFAQTIG